MKYGRYMVLSTFIDVVGLQGNKTRWANVECDCGARRKVRLSALKSGSQQSCGCLRNEKSGERSRAMATHGATRNGQRTPTYIVWKGMRSRCLQSDQPAYP